MLHGLQPCSPEQVLAQARRLFDTPVWRLACELRAGKRPLSAATIVSVHDLGTLPTIFGNIGGLEPPPGCGRVTFTVSEVLPLLRCHPDADPRMLRAIETLVAADAEGTVQYDATILRSRGALMLVDGNKRTIAFYENRRAAEGEIAYPVFVLGDLLPSPRGGMPSKGRRRDTPA